LFGRFLFVGVGRVRCVHVAVLSLAKCSLTSWFDERVSGKASSKIQ
jgi:hypothetical protein